MKEVIYDSPVSRCVLLQVEGALCASVEKEFDASFMGTEETEIKDYWL